MGKYLGENIEVLDLSKNILIHLHSEATKNDRKRLLGLGIFLPQSRITKKVQKELMELKDDLGVIIEKEKK